MLIPNNVVIYGIQTLSNLVLPDHVPGEPPFQWTQIELRSPSARLAQSAPPNPASQTVLDRFVEFAFDGLTRWDAQGRLD